MDITAQPKIIFRVTPEIKTWLRERAARNHRTVNGEILEIFAAIRRGEEDDPEGFAKLGTTYR